MHSPGYRYLAKIALRIRPIFQFEPGRVTATGIQILMPARCSGMNKQNY